MSRTHRVRVPSASHALTVAQAITEGGGFATYVVGDDGHPGVLAECPRATINGALQAVGLPPL